MTRSKSKTGALLQGVLADVVGYQIVQAQITTRSMYFRHVGEVLELRPVEYSLLMLLHANRAVTPKQLAQALELSAPNLTILLDKLQERGLLERVRSDTDRRSQHVLLTEAGQALAQRAVECTPLMEAELTDCLSPAERAMLLELLGKVAGYRRG
ncbi:MAG: MarR family winged helix-turn-helix transcriptional regulator [Leptothrix sp. (in: b-proteobacteria)]